MQTSQLLDWRKRTRLCVYIIHKIKPLERIGNSRGIGSRYTNQMAAAFVEMLSQAFDTANKFVRLKEITLQLINLSLLFPSSLFCTGSI